MKTWPGGFTTLEPGDACQPPEIYPILDGLSRGELESVLLHLAINEPAAFETALLAISGRRARRARLHTVPVTG